MTAKQFAALATAIADLQTQLSLLAVTPPVTPPVDDSQIREQGESEPMPNFNDVFPSTYLKASDLKGAVCVVTIERVEFEPVGREREVKAVVYFAGKTKGVVLNKTNGKKIAELANSPLTEDWPGTVIALYPTDTEFGGETVECIRVKAAPVVRQPVRERAVPAPVKPNGVDLSGPITADDIPF